MSSLGGAQAQVPEVRFSQSVPLEGLEEAAVCRVVACAWKHLAGPAGAVIEVAFIEEDEHCQKHDEFLGDPSPTDVMAFPYEDDDLFGEIIVNREMCVREAAARDRNPLHEALLYVAHGALHLLGLRDDTDETRAEMRRAESAVLAAAGV